MGLSIVMSDFGLLDLRWQAKFGERTTWCRENCQELFISDILSNEIRWSFVNEEDAMAFKLRWM